MSKIYVGISVSFCLHSGSGSPNNSDDDQKMNNFIEKGTVFFFSIVLFFFSSSFDTLRLIFFIEILFTVKTKSRKFSKMVANDIGRN